jgi:hypothetical protein
MEAATATTTQAPTPPPSPTDAPETPQEGTQEATGAVPEAPKTPEAPPKRFRKLKVNGAETEVDEESLILAGMRAEQKERAAQERWKAAQQAQAQVEAFQKAWETDPVAALDQLGPKAREAAEKFLMRELQREQMDPRERDLLAERAKREELEARFRAQEEEKAQAEQQRQQQHYVQQLDVEFAEVMRTANLPKTTESVRLLAQEAMQLTEMGIPPTRENLQAIVPLVQEKISKMATSVMGQMDGPGLLKWLGPDIRKRIREAEVAAVKGAKPVPGQAPVPPQPPPSGDERPRTTMLTQAEWRKKYGLDE